ncbi:MAG: flagellar hook-associated protein FlgL [Candidatus Melainabacteria bacterium]|nr:flagellar hook-associated protein FlgL [Candidatus Melainabacteria bacterium]
MTTQRVASSTLHDQAIRYLQNNLGNLGRLQEKVSTGRNINRPSDDPVGLTRILDLKNTLSFDDRYLRNINQALSELNTTDSALSDVTNIVQRALELANQGANATQNDQNRDAIAGEIDQLINQLVQVANTKVGNVYVFSGVRTSTATYTRTGNAVTYNGTPPAQAWQRNVEISSRILLPVNVNGQTVFGNVSTVAGPPEAIAAGSSGLFETMMELKLNLQQNDPDQVRARLDELQTNLGTVLGQQAIVGATANRLELTMNRLEGRKTIFSRDYAEIQEVDMAKTITDLQFQENIQQASLGVTARVLQPSLLNFLR